MYLAEATMENEVIPPPYVISESDKRGLVVVITATTLSFVWTCLLIRSWPRLKSREWKWDESFLTAATILDTAQSALVFHLVNNGFGTSKDGLSGLNLNQIGKTEFASQMLYILTLLLSKFSVLFLYLRLSPEKGHTFASWATIALSSVWALVSMILIAVPCNPTTFWSSSGTCSSVWLRWQAISAIDIITEAVIFLISVYLVAQLNMKTKAKAMVVMAFSARLPVIIVAAIRLHYLHATVNSADRIFAGSYYAVATQWHIGYAIMSTTITGLGPFLRPFSKSFSTSYKRSNDLNQSSDLVSSHGESQTRTQQKSRAVSYQLQPLKARPVNSSSPQEPSNSGGSLPVPSASSSTRNPHMPLRPDCNFVRRNTAVSGGDRTPSEEISEYAPSRASQESQQWIITKKTEVTVEMDRVSCISKR